MASYNSSFGPQRSVVSAQGKQDAKRPRQDSSEVELSLYICQKCDNKVDDGVTCTGCKLLFCISCAKISPSLYNCMMTGEMDSFRWNCKSCISSFPSLENITGVLQEIKATYDGRMTNIESRMDRFEEKTEQVITENVREMKDDIVDSLKGELSLLVDSRCRELDDRKRRELNLTVFNLPEHNKGNGQENRIHDERDISGICTDLGLVNVQISQSIRLGKKTEGKIRPLKIILTERAHRKFILDNAKYIPSKVRFEFRNVIFSKDLTPQQREERRKQIATKKEQRIPSTDGVITTKPHIYKEKTSNNYRPGPKVTGLQFAMREKAVSKNNEHPGSTSSASLHSTLLARPAMNKSPLVMEVDSQISQISPPNRLTHLNLLNVSSLNNSVIPEQQEFENTTIVDLEDQDTVIGGTQVSYHEETESPKHQY